MNTVHEVVLASFGDVEAVITILAKAFASRDRSRSMNECPSGLSFRWLDMLRVGVARLAIRLLEVLEDENENGNAGGGNAATSRRGSSMRLRSATSRA